jgi:hypothetical protein
MLMIPMTSNPSRKKSIEPQHKGEQSVLVKQPINDVQARSAKSLYRVLPACHPALWLTSHSLQGVNEDHVANFEVFLHQVIDAEC